MVKLNKDIAAFVVGQVLITALLLLWLRGVYHRELDGLKAETSVLFFNAIEDAKDKLFFNIHERVRSDFDTEIHFETKDSMVRREVFVYERTHLDLDSTHQDRMVKIERQDGAVDSQFEVTVDYSMNGLSAILVSRDSTLGIDFDTTKSYLSNILINKVKNSELRSLQIRVVDVSDPVVSQDEFRTDEASLGNIFFGTSAYAAQVGSYRRVVLARMIPEILMAGFFFAAIFYAFFAIYRSLLEERKLAAMKDDFISNISHELKTPLSVVHVAIEALENFDVIKDPDKSKEYLEISKAELGRLSNMVEKVLHFSNDGTTPREMMIGQLDIPESIKESVSTIELKHGFYNGIFNIQIADKLPKIEADRDQFRDLMNNLLDNSLKYGSGSNVDLHIRENNGFIEFKILDRGPGIPDEYKSEIFEKFFRVPSENIHEVKGYGLGLHIAKEVVLNHKGKISVKDRDGGGTEVSVLLPLKQ